VIVDSQALSPAALAFDAVAHDFDTRFGEWQSVAAQRGAVRRTLSTLFPAGSRILELGGGTGEDALWLAERGYRVLLTDASPRMVEIAARKLSAQPGSQARVLAAEEVYTLCNRESPTGSELFDGAFSNFAALNCVADLGAVARGLARVVRQNGAVALVMFGTLSAGDVLVELGRLRPKSAFRRFSHRAAPARLGGRTFSVVYHRPRDLALAMQPWFRMVRRRGIGVFVPPSAAEPWISRHPRLLGMLESLDEFAGDTLAAFGDHVLYQFERTAVPAPVKA
jgi:ubiquinone/menaquinone biosynthesis C-methylase UbiE